MTVLLLGGTGEARELAVLLVDAGVDVVSSLAGRVERPRLPVGKVRMGGFGGVDGLRSYLADHGVTAVVDATHPFAEGLSAKQMAQNLGISQRTVEFHKYRMMETLGARTSSDLIHFAIKHGIVEA